MCIGLSQESTARLLIKDLFSLYVAQSQQCTDLEKILVILMYLMYLIVFAATLFLVTIRLLSGIEKLGLPDLYPSYMATILKDFCDVTYGRKTCWALSSKVSAPISFKSYTFLKTGENVWFCVWPDLSKIFRGMSYTTDELIQLHILMYHLTWYIWKEWSLFPQVDNWSAEFVSLGR